MLVKFGNHAFGHCPLRRVERLARKRRGLFDKRDLSGFERDRHPICPVMTAAAEPAARRCCLLRFHPASP